MPQQDIQEDSFSSDEDFDDEETDSSSDADEKVAQDEIFDEEFLKCYSALKKKDSKIYDKNIKFFSEKPSEPTKGEDDEEEVRPSLLGLDKKSKKEPKMSILDHQLTVDNDAVEETEIQRPSLLLAQPHSYYDKELEEIKKSIVEAGGNEESDSDDELLVVKNSGEAGPSSASKAPPKEKAMNLLEKLEQKGDDDITHLKQIWSDPDKLSDEDRFLRDYILNKRYIPANVEDEKPAKGGFFSKNLDELSDVEEEEEDKKLKSKKHVADHHSDEKDFDKIARVPRNSTNTIRDLLEKKKKKEKRLKKMEKIKKKKKALKDADFEDIIGDLPTKFHYKEIEPVDYGKSAVDILLESDNEEDLEEEREKKAILEPSTSTRRRKRKRKMNREKFAKTGVAPDRLLAYGLSKSKLKKSKLL